MFFLFYYFITLTPQTWPKWQNFCRNFTPGIIWRHQKKLFFLLIKKWFYITILQMLTNKETIKSSFNVVRKLFKIEFPTGKIDPPPDLIELNNKHQKQKDIREHFCTWLFLCLIIKCFVFILKVFFIFYILYFYDYNSVMNIESLVWS